MHGVKINSCIFLLADFTVQKLEASGEKFCLCTG